MRKAVHTKYYQDTKCKNLDKENFPPLLKQVYEIGKCFTRLHVIAGFQYTGLFPLNKKRINQHALAISEMFNQPTPSTRLPTVQSLPLSSEPATVASRFDRYKALQERMKNEMENEMKKMSFLEEKNPSHLKKSRQSNIPKVAGHNITEHGIIDHLKRREKAKQLKLAEKEAKKRKTICKPLMPLPNPAENEVTQDEEPITLPAPKRRKVIKYRKFKKELLSDMMSRENLNCNTRLCNHTCLPKRFVMVSAFFCCKKCKT